MPFTDIKVIKLEGDFNVKYKKESTQIDWCIAGRPSSVHYKHNRRN